MNYMWRQELEKLLRGVSLNMKQIYKRHIYYFIAKNEELYMNSIGLRSLQRAGKCSEWKESKLVETWLCAYESQDWEAKGWMGHMQSYMDTRAQRNLTITCRVGLQHT